jgi:hypothetical protein
MVTLTIDEEDGRYAEAKNRTGRERPRTAGLLGDPRAHRIEQSLRYQSWAWNRLRTNLSRRKRLGRLTYYRGVELTKRGVAHVHVLVGVEDVAAFAGLRAALRGDERVRTGVRDGTVRENDRRVGLAIRAGFGTVVDVQLARSKGDVARYVAKMEDAGLALAPETVGAISKDASAYVVKGTTGTMPRYTRRTAYSMGRGGKRSCMDAWAPGWVRPTPIAGFDWRLAPAALETVTAALVASDFTIVDPARYRVGNAPPGAGSASA